MNILENLPKANFFGKNLLGIVNTKPKPASYSRMKEKQIARRRARNKVARKCRKRNSRGW